MILPDFSDETLSGLVVCCFFDAPNESLEEYRDQGFVGEVEYEGHWIRLKIEASGRQPEKLHFHVDVIDAWPDKRSPANSTLVELNAHASKFYGMQGRGWIRGRYEIAEGSVHERSLIRPFLGMSMEAGKEKLVIDGMHMRVHGGPFDEIEWQQTEGGIKAEIDALLDSIEIGEKVLIDSDATLRSGLNRFLLGDEDDDTERSDD